MSKALTNHFKGKRLTLPHGQREREGQTVPLTLWRCWCGRRLRGDARLIPHLERSGHGVAVAGGR